jgi:predicted kinase
VESPPGRRPSSTFTTRWSLQTRSVSSYSPLLKSAHPDDPEEKAANNEKVFKEFHNTIGRNLGHSVDTIADATNLTYDSRRKLIEIARKYKADVHLVLFDNPLQAVYRNGRRDDDQVVPDAAMDKFLHRLEETRDSIVVEDFDSVTRIGSVG